MFCAFSPFRSWNRLGPSWEPLGPLGGLLGAFWRLLGRLLGPLGALLGRSSGALGSLRGALGAMLEEIKEGVVVNSPCPSRVPRIASWAPEEANILLKPSEINYLFCFLAFSLLEPSWAILDAPTTRGTLRPGPGEGVGGGVNPTPKGKKGVGRGNSLDHRRPEGWWDSRCFKYV